MKKILPIILFIAFVSGIFYINNTKSTKIYKQPTEGQTHVLENMEEKENHEHKKKWFETIHQVAEGHSWKSMEANTSFKRHQERIRNKKYRGEFEELADGQLVGKWIEKGSRNQSGNVLVTDYMVETDEVWLISAGGTLWKSHVDQNNWIVVNEDLRFNNRFLKLVKGENGYRILTIINKIVHYSDDLGKTWNKSTGGDTFDNNWGRREPLVVMSDGNRSIQLLQYWDEESWGAKLALYGSIDNGLSFNKLFDFGKDNIRQYRLVKSRFSDDLYLFKSENIGTALYKYDMDLNSFDTIGVYPNYSFGSTDSNIHIDSAGKFYSYSKSGDDVTLFVLNNEEWVEVGLMPIHPWGRAFFISPSNPNLFICGGVECFISTDAGISWNKKNNWGDYYQDRDIYLHADMMNFDEFITSDNDNIILISNHGGLNISWDEMENVTNIGNDGLQVSQYYSVRTLPSDPDWIFGGTQDQGFQRGKSLDEESVVSFEQEISGDYGHIVFTGNDHLWTVYPGGWVIMYTNPRLGSITTSWQLPNSDNSAWIMPLVADPYAEKETIYLVGGSIGNGGGSYLHKLEYENAQITSEQIDFDFLQESGGYVSAFEIDPFEPDHWYTSTSNGLFYYSNDRGQSWDVSISVGPKPHYLYGTKILASSINKDVVYFAGSGYESNPVYSSIDGGETFFAMSNGLPSTLVYDLCSNDDESMFFAATEAGPYVYIVADDMWYDMSGDGAPTQTYWSVEYVSERDIIRFGTYGRGIWDFKINDVSNVKDAIIVDRNIKIFPNVSSDQINISHENKEMIVKMEIYDGNGRLIKEVDKIEIDKLNISSLSPAIYYLRTIDNKNRIRIGKFIKV